MFHLLHSKRKGKKQREQEKLHDHLQREKRKAKKKTNMSRVEGVWDVRSLREIRGIMDDEKEDADGSVNTQSS